MKQTISRAAYLAVGQ